jgi:hypothetical protein
VIAEPAVPLFWLPAVGPHDQCDPGAGACSLPDPASSRACRNGLRSSGQQGLRESGIGPVYRHPIKGGFSWIL